MQTSPCRRTYVQYRWYRLQCIFVEREGTEYMQKIYSRALPSYPPIPPRPRPRPSTPHPPTRRLSSPFSRNSVRYLVSLRVKVVLSARLNCPAIAPTRVHGPHLDSSGVARCFRLARIKLADRRRPTAGPPSSALTTYTALPLHHYCHHLPLLRLHHGPPSISSLYTLSQLIISLDTPSSESYISH